MTETHHRAGADHIEDELLGGAGLHARRSGEHLGADIDHNRQIGGKFQGGIPVANESNGFCAFLLCMLQRGQCVGSTTTGGDSDDNIFLAGFAAGDVFLAQIERVFLVFYCRMQRFVAAGDDVLNEFGADAESGRNFGGVERTQATTGSGSGVNQGPPLPSESATRSMAFAIWGNCFSTALGTLWSSRLIA